MQQSRWTTLIIHNSKHLHKKGHPKAALIIVIRNYFTSINSTSKINVASGGITPPAPREP